MPAIASKDEINISANKHYFKEPSLEKVLVLVINCNKNQKIQQLTITS